MAGVLAKRDIRRRVVSLPDRRGYRDGRAYPD